MTVDIAHLLSQDALTEAVDTAVSAVKVAPQDANIRVTLAQLLALSGDLARAETHAKMAQTLDMERAMALSVFRQHLRALDARDAWWANGATPEFPGKPTQADAAAMALQVALRDGDLTQAASCAATLEDIRVPTPACWDGAAVDDLRDVDDRLPHALEALTAGGHYLWIDFARVARLELMPVAAPFDLLARSARVTLRDGAGADVRLVAIYDGPRGATERLGRMTDFSELAPGLVRGHGQRAFLAGDTLVGILDPTEVVFDV
ncbi:hypothetical protein KUV51_02940 [Tateyamaria omphalii]|uniref:type VI secretion system accessory protein TagJ n=1 Tax=Tateyamaria omphalii TaxID=299262 RepID=UPI001C98EBC7|nr:type VI secretion system accessory protein TagJ [Tateyamaria omphalii]MBY5931946.1 hypothetical protein [Tateyamaria omphalii]